MKKHMKYFSFVFVTVLGIIAGCQSNDTVVNGRQNKNFLAKSEGFFSPGKIEITPLTELMGNSGKIKVNVAVFDRFDCQQKVPAVFRFELYRRELRSSDQKGKRIKLWTDIDLTDPAKNNHYWKDFLRSYEFELEFEEATQPSILEVTCICPDQKRLSAEFVLIK